MTSLSKIAANERNAQRSTGPRTPAGKAVSARNALTHGLTAQDPLLPGETIEQYDAFQDRWWTTYQPTGVRQESLLKRVVDLVWRLRRVPGLEAAALRFVIQGEPKDGAGFAFLRHRQFLTASLPRYEAGLWRHFRQAWRDFQLAQEEEGWLESSSAADVAFDAIAGDAAAEQAASTEGAQNEPTAEPVASAPAEPKPVGKVSPCC